MQTVSITLRTDDGKSALAWLAPNYGGPTHAIALNPDASLDVFVPVGGRTLTIIVVEKLHSAKGGFGIVGTATFEIKCEDGAKTAHAPLIARPSGVRSTRLQLTIHSKGASIAGINPTNPDIDRRCYRLIETTWHTDTCIANGIESMRPVRLDDAGIRRLAKRWSTYYTLATAITESTDNNTLLNLVISVNGGNYHHEQGDRRHPSDLSWCKSDDCDGMAWSAVIFYTQVFHYARTLCSMAPFKGQGLLKWATDRYPSALVVYGNCKSPINSKPFMHAWLVLAATPLDAHKCWSRLSSEQRAALETAGIDESTWRQGDTATSIRNTLSWAKLGAAQKMAMSALGYTQPMWDVVLPKIHGDATGIVNVVEKDTTPNALVNKRVKEIRKQEVFGSTSLVVPRAIRGCFTQYESVVEVHGPYYAHKFKPMLHYMTEFFNSHFFGPRNPKTCCTAENTRGRQPVFVERSEKDALVGQIETTKGSPESWAPRENVSFYTNPEGPFSGEIPEHLTRFDVSLDPFVSWVGFACGFCDKA